MGTPIFDSKIEKLKKYLDERMNPDALWEDRWAATDKKPFSDTEIDFYKANIENKLYQLYTQRGQATQTDAWKLGLQMDFLRAYHQAYIHRTMYKSYYMIYGSGDIKKINATEKNPNTFSWLKKKVDELGGTE